MVKRQKTESLTGSQTGQGALAIPCSDEKPVTEPVSCLLFRLCFLSQTRS